MPARNGVLFTLPGRRRTGPTVLQRVLGDALRARFALDGYEILEEFRFAPPRRWRFDLCVRKQGDPSGVAVEFQGGVWSGGRHTRGTGYLGDLEKTLWGAALGWTVVGVGYDQLRDRFDEVLKLIVRAVEVRGR